MTVISNQICHLILLLSVSRYMIRKINYLELLKIAPRDNEKLPKHFN